MAHFLRQILWYLNIGTYAGGSEFVLFSLSFDRSFFLPINKGCMHNVEFRSVFHFVSFRAGNPFSVRESCVLLSLSFFVLLLEIFNLPTSCSFFFFFR